MFTKKTLNIRGTKTIAVRHLVEMEIVPDVILIEDDGGIRQAARNFSISFVAVQCLWSWTRM